MSGGREGKIRRWRAEDGKEVGTPMDAGSEVYNIAVSQDGKWIVCRARSGKLAVWNAQNHKKVTGWKGHSDWVLAVNISPDGTRIATGSYYDCTVWSLLTGQRLLSLRHNNTVVGPSSRPMDASPLPRGDATAFGSLTVRTAASLSTFQSRSSLTHTTNPLSGSAIA